MFSTQGFASEPYFRLRFLLISIAKLLLNIPISKKHPSSWCKNLLTKWRFLVKKAKHYVCDR